MDEVIRNYFKPLEFDGFKISANQITSKEVIYFIYGR